jgi:Zn-dependent peptidase ImmA (M78 family)
VRQGTPGFNGKRLKQARDIYGLTVTSLAEMIGISKQAISQFEKSETGEKGASTPRPEILDKISTHFNFPRNFFLHESYIVNKTPIHYRSLSAATKSARARAESKFLWLQEITSTLKQYVELPTVNLPLFDVKNYTNLSAKDIEDLASATRRYWGLGDGPISNVLNLFENNGIVVSRLDLEADTLDALSQWSSYDSTPYIFLSSAKQSAARSRFDLSHELAHLIAHVNLNKNICYNPIEHSVLEKQAHRFASAFLLPAQSFTNDLVSPTLDCFWALKEKWQVSIAAMIMRCSHLEIIEEDYARKLWINYNRRGWAKREPLDERLAIEQPKLLRRSFELLVKEQILTREDITSQLPYPKLALEEIINLPKGFLSMGDNVEFLPTLKRLPRVEGSTVTDSKVINFPNRKK